MEATTNDPTCTMCGELLNDQEIEGPERDDAGDAICDECYHEHYTFDCSLCQEEGETKDQHNMIVVFNEAAGVPVGTYKVTDYPYYICSILGDGEILPFRVERIADVPDGAESDDHWCGHLCRCCQEDINQSSNQAIRPDPDEGGAGDGSRQ